MPRLGRIIVGGFLIEPTGGEGGGGVVVAFVTDDLADLVLIKRVGFGVAVANACVEVKMAADYITGRKGGAGAVREVVELILKAQDLWGPQLYEH